MASSADLDVGPLLPLLEGEHSPQHMDKDGSRRVSTDGSLSGQGVGPLGTADLRALSGNGWTRNFKLTNPNYP